MVNQFIAFIPTLVAIIILIIVGKILGTFLGKLGARALDRIGLDDLVDRTVIGGMIRRGRMSTVAFFDAIIRWLVYIIFASIILNLLNIQAVNKVYQPDNILHPASYLCPYSTNYRVLDCGFHWRSGQKSTNFCRDR